MIFVEPKRSIEIEHPMGVFRKLEGDEALEFFETWNKLDEAGRERYLVDLFARKGWNDPGPEVPLHAAFSPRT